MPACAEIRAVDAGMVWVRDFPRTPDEAATWRIFVDGRLVGALRLESGAALEAVTGDRIATVERDDVEIEHVRIYGLPEGLIPE